VEYITFKNFFLLLLALFGGYAMLRLASFAIAKSWFQAKQHFIESQNHKEVDHGKEENEKEKEQGQKEVIGKEQE